MRIERIRFTNDGQSIDLTTRMVILIFAISTIQALPPDWPGIPSIYVPYLKALISGLTAALIFLLKGSSNQVPASYDSQNIPLRN